MKPTRSNPLFSGFFRANTLASAVVVTLAAFALVPSAHAVDVNQTWNTAGPTNTWNTTDLNWDVVAAWGANNKAIFGGTGEAVTVGTVAANAISFNSTGYALTSGTITLGAAVTPITANSNASISSILAFGTNSLSTAGTGTLTLGGVNTGTGAIGVTAGTLKLGNASALGTSSLVTVSSAATLDLAGFSANRPTEISGTGAGSTPALYSSSSTVGSSVASLKLNAPATIGNGSTDRSFMLSVNGTTDLNTNKLTVTGGAVSLGISNITSGDIDINSGGAVYLGAGGTLTNVTGTITVKTGGVLDTRDVNNSSMTSLHNIALNGGRLGNALITNNNGGGGGAILKNNITVDAANGGILDGNNTGFGLYLRLAGSISGAGALTLQGGKGVEFQGDGSGYTGLATATAGTVSFNTAVAQSFNGGIAGGRPLTKSGSGITTLGGNLSYTGLTTVSGGGLVLTGTNTSASGGLTLASGTTLKLDYGTNDNRKIPSGVLTLNGNSIELAGSVSSAFADSVASTTLSAGSTSSISRSSGNNTLNLGAITPGVGALLNIAQSNIAKTSTLNNSGGTLGAWAMVGTELAMNDGSGNIVAYTGYTPVTRLSSGSKSFDGTSSNIQIVDGTGTAGDILLGSPVTTISSLNQSATGGTAVIDPAGSTLAVDTILVGTGAGSLIIGNGTNNGILKSGGTSLGFRNLSGAAVTVNSIIANGTGASTLTKWDAGSLNLTAANTYTGATTVSGGSLVLSGTGSLADSTDINLGASGTSFDISGISASSETIGSIAGVSGSSVILSGRNLTAGGTNATTTLAGVISGIGGSLTKTGTGSLTLSGVNTYTGNTIVSAGTVVLGSGSAFGTVQTGKPVSQVTVASGASVSLNAIAATYGYTIAGTGVSSNGALYNNSATAISTGLAQTSNIKLSANASVGGSGSWALLTNGYAATTLDLGGFTLTKSGAGTFTLANTTATAGAITVAGGVLATFNTAPNLSAAALTLNNTAGVSLTPATALSIGSLSGGGSTGGGITLAGNTLTMGALGTNTAYAGVIAGTGTGSAIVKTGSGTQTFSGANTYTGTTTVSGGVLALDYAAQNNTKLSDSTALIFGGVSGLSLNNGSHTETVSATTLNAGANVTISRPSGSGLLQMNAITRGAGASLNFTSSGIATTDTTNTNGILGGWATVGNDFATNSTNAADGLITAYTGYTDVTRLESGTKAIADATASNVRIIEGIGSTPANITLAAATTNINTLLQSGVGGTSAAIVALPSSTLRLGTAGALMASSDSGALTIGSAVGEGTLTAGGNASNVAGDVSVITSSANTLTINSVIANNGSGAVTLNKQGTGAAVLAGANSYTGTTTVSGGTLEVSNNANGASKFYTVAQGAALKLGYSTSVSWGAGCGVTVNGISTGDASGLYLAGGKTLQFGSTLTLQTAPSTVRAYGVGTATLNGGDVNNTHLSVGSAASGSVIDTAVSLGGNSYGYRMNVAAGASTATGDLVINGVMVGGSNSGFSNFRKEGTGSILINSTGTFGTGIDLMQGTIILGGNNRLPSASYMTFGSGGNSGKLILNGYSQTLSSISTVGSGTTNAIVGASSTLSTLTVSNSSNATYAGRIGGSGANEDNVALVKSGTAVLTLSGTSNSYTGTTTVNGGTLRVTNASGSATSAGAVTVNAGGTVDGSGTISGTVSVSSGGGTITAGNADVGNLTVGALSFDGVANVNVLPGTTSINVTNALTASGAANSVTINIGSTPLATGVHHLISHSGAILGTGFGAFKVGTNPGGPYTYTLVDNAGYLDLQVSTSAIFWKGNLSSEWSTVDQNWQVGGSPVSYTDSTAVVFDDTADTKDVTIDTANVAPGSVLFSNSLANDYTLSGSKAITGTASLSKSGTGYVTITNVNSFTGGVTISQGTLDVNSIANSGTDSALGAGSSIVLGGGTLAYWGVDASSDRSVAINSASTLDVGSGSLTLTGVLSGTGSLTKTSPANLVLTNAANSLTGAININAGAISVDDIAKLGTGSIATAAAGTLILNPAAAATLSRSVTGAGTLRKQAAGTLNVSTGGSNILPNKVVVETGTLQISSGAFSGDRMNGSGLLTVDAGATLLLSSAHSLGGDNNGISDALNILGTVTVNGEQYVSVMTLDGGTINGASEIRVPASGSYLISGSAPSSISAKVQQRYSSASWNVSDVTGDATADLVVSGQMYDVFGFVKSGAGTMRLTGINTYTGNTTVNAGTLELADNARLAFAIPASGASNKISGAGTVTLDGDFAINTAAAAALTGGNWTLEDVTASTYGAAFTVMDPDGTLWTPVGSDKWTKSAAGGKTWTFDETTGVLTLTQSGYSGWESLNGITGAGASADSDGDGIPNGIEFVIGGDPSGPDSNSSALLPTITVDGTYLNFVFRRTADSAAYDPFVEYGSTLAGWTPAEAGVSGVIVNEDAEFFGTGIDRVTVRIPRTLAVDSKLFGRLHVDITP